MCGWLLKMASQAITNFFVMYYYIFENAAVMFLLWKIDC